MRNTQDFVAHVIEMVRPARATAKRYGGKKARSPGGAGAMTKR